MYCCPIDVLVIDHWKRLRRRAMGTTATWRRMVAAVTPTTTTTTMTTTMMLTTCNHYVLGKPTVHVCVLFFLLSLVMLMIFLIDWGGVIK